MLRINLIGRPEITALGKLPKKASALLFYLGMQEGACAGREKLADLLWPYQGREEARHSLRNCLLALRTALRCSGAVISPLQSDFVSIGLTDFATDLHEYQALCAAGRIAEAIELCRGELLEEFYLESEPFSDWVKASREQFANDRCSVMMALISELEMGGEYQAAMRVAKKAIALDPWNEELHRRFMSLAAKAGLRGAAIFHYKALAAELMRELGADPDQETQELVSEIAGLRMGELHAVEDRWRKIEEAVRDGLKPPIPPSLIRKTVAVLKRERLRKTVAVLKRERLRKTGAALAA